MVISKEKFGLVVYLCYISHKSVFFFNLSEFDHYLAFWEAEMRSEMVLASSNNVHRLAQPKSKLLFLTFYIYYCRL